MEKNTINLGTIWELNERYDNNYNYAIVTYDLKTQETVVELWSNWNSNHNKTDRIKHVDPLDVVKRYSV